VDVLTDADIERAIAEDPDAVMILDEETLKMRLNVLAFSAPSNHHYRLPCGSRPIPVICRQWVAVQQNPKAAYTIFRN